MASATQTLTSSPTTALTLANVLYEKKGAIAYVTVNRPTALNALDLITWKNLRTAFESAQNDATVRGVILTGAGNKAFIAGADIGELAQATAFEPSRRAASARTFSTHRASRQAGDRGRQWLCARRRLRDGDGVHHQDRSGRAKFGQPEVTLGLIPGYGGTQRLPRLVGKGRALQLILSGEMISAQEAYRIGLVNEIVPAVDLVTRAEAILARRIASNAPIAVRFALEAANKGVETSQSEGLLLEASYFGLCAATEDKKEGTSAFLEKRVPQFHGR